MSIQPSSPQNQSFRSIVELFEASPIAFLTSKIEELSKILMVIAQERSDKKPTKLFIEDLREVFARETLTYRVVSTFHTESEELVKLKIKVLELLDDLRSNDPRLLSLQRRERLFATAEDF